MNRYFKYRREETRGDNFDDWGFSTWYFETDKELFPLRQIEVYDTGKIIKYDFDYLGDEFGMLGDKSIDEEEIKETTNVEISQDEFENVWTSLKAFNR